MDGQEFLNEFPKPPTDNKIWTRHMVLGMFLYATTEETMLFLRPSSLEVTIHLFGDSCADLARRLCCVLGTNSWFPSGWSGQQMILSLARRCATATAPAPRRRSRRRSEDVGPPDRQSRRRVSRVRPTETRESRCKINRHGPSASPVPSGAIRCKFAAATTTTKLGEYPVTGEQC